MIDMSSIEQRVEEYRLQLVKEQEAIEKYRKEFDCEPCCAIKAMNGSCVCWQDGWC